MKSINSFIKYTLNVHRYLLILSLFITVFNEGQRALIPNPTFKPQVANSLLLPPLTSFVSIPLSDLMKAFSSLPIRFNGWNRKKEEEREKIETIERKPSRMEMQLQEEHK